jgi:hypothetical protein
MIRIATMLLLLATPAMSQTQAPPPAPCSAPEFRQLDFWVGDWDLTWPAQQGQPEGHGHNRIEREFDNCVIHENFTDNATPPFRGTSYSTYVPQAKQWKQTWVDNQGSYLDFTGEFKDGQMILSRDGVDRQGKALKQRMIFKNIKPDSFDWSWERSDDGGKTWQVQWPIHYSRKK